MRKASRPTARVQAAETTHIVPYTARPNTASVIKSVQRNKPRTSEAELLKNALRKVNSNMGGRQSQLSLTEFSTQDDTSSMWNGGMMQSMADDEEIDTIELSFDTDLMTAESIQTGCSDTRATQKTSVEFLDFNDSNYVMPTVVGEVSTFSMGSAASHSNSSAAAASKPNSSGDQLSDPLEVEVDYGDMDSDWISLANDNGNLAELGIGTA